MNKKPWQIIARAIFFIDQLPLGMKKIIKCSIILSGLIFRKKVIYSENSCGWGSSR